MFQSGLALCALSGPLLHRLNLSVFVLFYFDESRSAQRKSVMARVFTYIYIYNTYMHVLPRFSTCQAGGIRIVTSSASTPKEVLSDLQAEAKKLQGALTRCKPGIQTHEKSCQKLKLS